MRIWPFAQFFDWLEWRKRDRQKTIVATWLPCTEIINNWDEQKPTGEVHLHVTTFYVDGNGIRYSRVLSSDKWGYEKRHSGIIKARTDWQVHGDLPPDARRVDDRPRGKLISIIGGRDGAA